MYTACDQLLQHGWWPQAVEHKLTEYRTVEQKPVAAVTMLLRRPSCLSHSAVFRQ